MTPNELVDAWRSVRPGEPPYVLPQDEAKVGAAGSEAFASFADFCAAYPLPRKAGTRFHLGLVPMSYLGNLQRARVYILMLNPGFGPIDYFAEEKDTSYKAALWDNLRQADSEYPFPCLNPAFSFTGGFQYWTRKDKLGWVLDEMMERGSSPRDALRELSNQVCVLQAVPYHSIQFKSTAAIRSLTSTCLVGRFAKGTLVPRAERGDALILVLRQARAWDLKKDETIICYEGSKARGARLGPDSDAGAQLRRFLVNNEPAR